MAEVGAVVLAGGAGRRLGGPAKPRLTVGGAPLLSRVLAAVPDGWARIVVGPAGLAGILPDTVGHTVEQPPGGGPVAAAAAGLKLLPRGVSRVALLAADLPFLTPDALRALAAVVTDRSTVDGAVFADEDGRRQLLCGLWWVDALRPRLATVDDHAGRSVRWLVGDLRVRAVSWSGTGPPPWYDCDTEADLDQAREWA